MKVDKKQFHVPKKVMAGAVVVGALFGVLAIGELLFLRGEAVASRTGLRFSRSETKDIVFPITRCGEKHTIVVNTRKYKVALSWKVRGPQGQVLYSDTEFLRHTGDRRCSFVPRVAGDYHVEIERNRGSSTLSSGTRDSASVQLLVGDRRVIGPFMDWFKF